MLVIRYEHCDHVWFDTYECACDSECPVCGKDIEPLGWEDAEILWDMAVKLQRLQENL